MILKIISQDGIHYDDKGNNIEFNFLNSDGSLDTKLTYHYDYDTENNWIEQIKYKNNIPQEIIERTIEYY